MRAYPCIALISLFLILGPYTASAADLKDAEGNGKRIVAKVNGKPLYEEQLTPLVNEALKKYKKYGMQSPSPDLLKSQREQELDRLIDQELLSQASDEIEIPDIEKKIDEHIKTMKETYSSEERFKEQMKKKGLTTESLRDSLRRKIAVDAYLSKKGLSNPEIPETDIQKYYEDNKANFKREESVKVRHILIGLAADAEPDERQQKREKAEKIRKSILDGRDFSEAAKEYSECNSASGGGDLGYIQKKYMPEEFDRVAFSLKQGEVSEVVETKYGFHLIEVTDKKPQGVVPYDEIKDFIRTYLKMNTGKKKTASHISELREKAKIEKFLN
jgi:peptidyl-prolyl cis-trans isomerase C